MSEFKPHEDYNMLLRQANAMNSLIKSQERIIAHYSKKDFEANERRINALTYSIESEKEMNAVLTAENESLRKQLENTSTQSQCDAADKLINRLYESGVLKAEQESWVQEYLKATPKVGE